MLMIIKCRHVNDSLFIILEGSNEDFLNGLIVSISIFKSPWKDKDNKLKANWHIKPTSAC